MELLGHHLSDELKQEQAITEKLIHKILYSKRLLVDHVEALEQCMLHIKDTQLTVEEGKRSESRKPFPEIFTARNTCILLGSALVEHLITPRSLRLTAVPTLLFTGVFSVVYVAKNAFGLRNRIVECGLENLIRTIDEFGNCIRRNMTYFNEIIIMKQQELIESRQIERAWDCITAAKEVTEILYEATRQMETKYPIPGQFSEYYAPMEELRDCDYFKNNVTDYNPKHIKDFHNIFVYVQSQFLLRLALTILTKPSLSELNVELQEIDSLIRQLVQEEENHFQNLSIELSRKQALEIETLNADRAMKTRNNPVSVLQDSSLKLSACMVAVAGECQALDTTLQRLTETEAEHKDNAKQLLQVANNMRSIESALSVCFDDFQRLMLVYNKFLSSKLDLKRNNLEEEDDNKSSLTDDEYPESFLRVEISQNATDAEKKDDFYAYMFDVHQERAEREQQEKGRFESLDHDLEILNFEKRITKGKFRPVLKQLKDRIDPIRQVMLEKEREVLAAKGINVEELFREEPEEERNFADNRDNDDQSNSDSEDSAEFEMGRRTRNLKKEDKFEEMRNFLAQKQAINIFKFDLSTPMNTVGDEEILESEC